MGTKSGDLASLPQEVTADNWEQLQQEGWVLYTNTSWPTDDQVEEEIAAIRDKYTASRMKFGFPYDVFLKRPSAALAVKSEIFGIYVFAPGAKS